MNKLYKNIWRLFERYKLSKKNVKFIGMAHFNQNTFFAGNNKIGEKSSVSNSSIGRFTYMGRNNNFNNVEIGAFCSIGSNITIVSATHPSTDFVSTHPAFYSATCQAGITFVDEDKFEERLHINGKKLIIGNDVWIGHHATILGGIKIGDGAIIGTRALVTKDVPPYAIVGGVPARIIRYRFTNEQIKMLEVIKWWDKDDDWLKTHIQQFRSIEMFVNIIKNE